MSQGSDPPWDDSIADPSSRPAPKSSGSSGTGRSGATVGRTDALLPFLRNDFRSDLQAVETVGHHPPAGAVHDRRIAPGFPSVRGLPNAAVRLRRAPLDLPAVVRGVRRVRLPLLPIARFSADPNMSRLPRLRFVAPDVPRASRRWIGPARRSRRPSPRSLLLQLRSRSRYRHPPLDRPSPGRLRNHPLPARECDFFGAWRRVACAALDGISARPASGRVRRAARQLPAIPSPPWRSSKGSRRHRGPDLRGQRAVARRPLPPSQCRKGLRLTSPTNFLRHQRPSATDLHS